MRPSDVSGWSDAELIVRYRPAALAVAFAADHQGMSGGIAISKAAEGHLRDIEHELLDRLSARGRGGE